MLRYLKEAFWVRPLVKGLGHVPINALGVAVFTVLGMAHPAFWLLGLGLEGAFLFGLASNPRFQQWVRGRDLQRRSQDGEKRAKKLVRHLDEASRDRLAALHEKRERIVEMCRAADDSLYSPGSDEAALRNLEWSYLKLLLGRQFLKSPAGRADERELRAQIQELEQDLADGSLSRAAQQSKEATLRILEQRVENRTRREHNREEIESALMRIEAQFDLAVENATFQGRPLEISASIELESRVLDSGAFGDQASTIADLDATFGLAPPARIEQ